MNVNKLRGIIRELIKTELEEANSIGSAGAGSSFNSGEGMGYMTPFAFKKKRKKK